MITYQTNSFQSQSGLTLKQPYLSPQRAKHFKQSHRSFRIPTPLRSKHGDVTSFTTFRATTRTK